MIFSSLFMINLHLQIYYFLIYIIIALKAFCICLKDTKMAVLNKIK